MQYILLPIKYIIYFRNLLTDLKSQCLYYFISGTVRNRTMFALFYSVRSKQRGKKTCINI